MEALPWEFDTVPGGGSLISGRGRTGRDESVRHRWGGSLHADAHSMWSTKYVGCVWLARAETAA